MAKFTAVALLVVALVASQCDAQTRRTPPPPPIPRYSCLAGPVKTVTGQLNGVDSEDLDTWGPSAFINSPGNMFATRHALFVTTSKFVEGLNATDNSTYTINKSGIKTIGLTRTFGSSTIYSARPDSDEVPTGVVVDPVDNTVYWVSNDLTVRKMCVWCFPIVLAGQIGVPGGDDGPGKEATFSGPTAITLVGNTLYVADSTMIRAVNKVTGFVTTISGAIEDYSFMDGPLADARYDSLYGIFADAKGTLIVTESSRVRTIKNGNVTTIAGDMTGEAVTGYKNGRASAALFDQVEAAWAYDADNVIFVVESGNKVVRRIAAGRVSTYAGFYDPTAEVSDEVPGAMDGPAATATFNEPQGIFINTASRRGLMVSDLGANAVRQVACA